MTTTTIGSGGRFVVGVDVGTGSARAGVFSLSGERRGLAVHPIQMFRPRPDYAEHSSGDIWDAVGRATREAVAQSGAAPEAIVGIGFDATCSLVLLNENDRPVTVSPDGNDDSHNVIVWMDHRATEEADAINAGGHDVLRYVGGRISPEMEPPKLQWLKRHRPDSWARAAKFLDLADFLTYQATGCDVRSLCTTVCKWTYLGHENRWDESFWAALDLSDVLEDSRGRKRAGTAIRPPGERVGPLTPTAAQHLGLSPDCQVGVGIIDAHAGGVGLLGAAWQGRDDTDPAVLESVLALIGGTSNCHMAASRAPVFVPGVWGPYFGAMVPGTWLTEGGQSAAGALIDHVIENHAAHPALSGAAQDKKTTVYALLNERIQALADQRHLAHPAYLTRDLHVLDYHLGNRSPFADPHARGVMDGLSLDQGADDLALRYLATVQAVAYGTRAIVEALNASGFAITALLATGGGTKNPLWLREHADACQTTLTLGREPESVLLGAAILGAAAAGNTYPDVLSAMKAMGRSGETIAPDPAPRAYHDAKFAVYRALYEEQNRHRDIMRAVPPG